MKFYTVKEKNRTILAVSAASESLYRLSDLGMQFSDMNDLICRIQKSELEQLKEAVQEAEESEKVTPMDRASITLCAPIPCPLQDVVCLGINYDEHAKEAARFSGEAFEKDRPYTIYFSKRVNEAVADGEEIPSYPGLVDSLDYEAELGVILSRDAKGVKEEDAADYIFGYTVINDVSARNIQTRHKQWYLGKSLDRFTPMGPCIVTADAVADVHNLEVRSFVNGELRQNSNTRYMIQSVEGAIAELSAGMTLKAGTIIATGTPAGVGMGFQPPKFLKEGDTVICEISEIGRICNRVGK